MLTRMEFTPEAGYADGGAYPTAPDSEEAAREQLMRPHLQAREYINGMLLPGLEAETGAAEIGAAALYPGDVPETVQGKLRALRKNIDDIVQGGIADGSVTTEKLAADVVIDGGNY